MIAEFGAQVASGVYWYVATAGLCTVVEILFAGERQTWLSRLRGFGFWLLFIPATTTAALLASAIMRVTGTARLMRLDLTAASASENWVWSVLGYAVFPFLSFLISDLAYYFFHRLQHSVPFLWRFHAVHHSIEELNVFNNYHHVSEEFFRVPLITLPLNLLFGLSVPQTTVVVGLMLVATQITHANTRIGFGPLRYILSEPMYHRIHHSVERKHWDKNFAFKFPVWDILFGTAHFPACDEFPRTGLDYMREPRSVRQYLFPRAPILQKSPLPRSITPASPPDV